MDTDGCVNRNNCFICITHAQKVILHTANTLQNNPPRCPYIFANDKEGAEYQLDVCDASMCTPLVKTLLRCPHCFQTASHAAASSI